MSGNTSTQGVPNRNRRSTLITGMALGAAAVLGLSQLGHPNPAPAAAPPSQPAAVREGIETLRTFSEAFSAVAETVKPAVVSIIVEKRNAGWNSSLPPGHPSTPKNGSPFEGTPFEYFFFGPHGFGQGEAPLVKGGGSGVILQSDGKILTNNHVVDGAEKITVILNDGREFEAQIKGTDVKTDLAVIEINAQGLPTVKLGNSEKTRVGEWVIAVGSPYGFDYTVTAGIVSAKGRKVMGGQKYEDFIQTDASINPGNSGGPLVNLDGEVIGINTMIAGIGTGIGFAIPSSMADNVARQLLTQGKVVRPWMGVGIQSVTAEMVESLKLPEKKGAIVAQVYEGSPAGEAGLQTGDVIIKVGEQEIEDGDALIKEILNHEVGEEIRLVALRDGKTVRLKVRTAVMPEDPTTVASSTSKRVDGMGLEVQNMTSELAEKMGLRTPGGVIVNAVRPNSPAAEAGLSRGDVILEINRRPINTVSDFEAATREYNAGTVLLLVGRDGSTSFIPLRLRQ